jgi:hypothetical protein
VCWRRRRASASFGSGAPRLMGTIWISTAR